MKSRETDKKHIRTRRVTLSEKRQAESPSSKASAASLDALSALIKRIRGSYKGEPSLVAFRELDHKRDERAKSKKLGAMYR